MAESSNGIEPSKSKKSTLLPTLIDKEDPAYTVVEELAEVLEETLGKDSKQITDNPGRRVKNIAITGPYGSGKSSIIQTLENDFAKYRYLNLSLATLRVDDLTSEDSDKNDSDKKDVDKKGTDKKDSVESHNEDLKIVDSKAFDELNRRIEYSIIQQLIYREESKTVPNSRLRRISHYKPKELTYAALSVLVFIICFFIVFEPTWFRVDTFFDFFNLGKYNIIADIPCALILLYGLYWALKRVIRSYSNSKLNKLNLKDGEIEVKDASIFNKHLDEILYFFQATEYNVVVIEDLDRFGTPDIFLKLRELNQLLNESHIIDRPIVFVYAVKDDIFIDEDRVKFFDYIVTVIPAINPSNSKTKLKKHLASKGYTDFKDEDLSEMGFFIQDMRLLINIVNEFDQYYKRLISSTDNATITIDKTKLLAMIIYKNFFPRDFADLHRRCGKVYGCLQLKDKFIELGYQDIKAKEQELDDLIESKKNASHLKVIELRKLFIYQLASTLRYKPVQSININGSSYSLSDISANDARFEELLKLKHLNYYADYSRSDSIDVVKCFSDWGYDSRIKALNMSFEDIEKLRAPIRSEKLSITSLRVCDLLTKYPVEKVQEYKDLKLPDLIDVFLRNGYLDEDYYDYISYFYEGMLSISDREILIKIKRQREGNPLVHIDFIENFVKELKPHNFSNDAILYVELLDYLIAPSGTASHRYLELFYERICREKAPLSFMADFYRKGKQQKTAFSRLISWSPDSVWTQILNHNDNEERKQLICAYLKYAKHPVSTNIITWVNDNYNFIVENEEELGHDIIDTICANEDSLFSKLELGSTYILSCVINQNAYVLNHHNLCVITSFLEGSSEVSDEELTLTRIWATKNETLKDWIQDNIEDVINILSNVKKDESAEALQYLLNQEDLTDEVLDNYLKGQEARIIDLDRVPQNRWFIVIKNGILTPSWNQLAKYQSSVGSFDQTLLDYVTNHAEGLSLIRFDKNEESELLFFTSLMSSKSLNLSTIKTITPVFKDYSFDGEDCISELTNDHLEWLLDNDMIEFCEDNNSLLFNTDIFAKYLIKYKGKFLEIISSDLLSRPNVVQSLLDSPSFTASEKIVIIDNIPDSVLFNSRPIADRVLNHANTTNSIITPISKSIAILKTASLSDTSIGYTTNLISNSEIDTEICDDIVNALGGDYADLSDQSKNPKFKDTSANKELLDALESISYISSARPCKDGMIRAYKSRK